MKNNQLIEYKENIFKKIKNFFKSLFIRKKETIPVQNEVKENNNSDEKKKIFMELYEKTKKGEVDLFSIETDKLEKMCILLEEEIKIKERNLQEKKNRLSA